MLSGTGWCLNIINMCQWEPRAPTTILVQGGQITLLIPSVLGCITSWFVLGFSFLSYPCTQSQALGSSLCLPWKFSLEMTLEYMQGGGSHSSAVKWNKLSSQSIWWTLQFRKSTSKFILYFISNLIPQQMTRPDLMKFIVSRGGAMGD